MIALNPGCLLPAYDKKRWQAHRWRGGDVYPNALVCPRTRLMPFQCYYSGAAPSVKVFELVSMQDDSTVVSLTNELTVDVKSDGSGYWVTWMANEELSTVPDCGYYYPRWTLDGEITYFEVLELRDLCGFNSAKLSLNLDLCSADGTDVEIPFVIDIYSAPGYVFTLERRSIGWEAIAANVSTYQHTETQALEEMEYRLVITNVCGDILTVNYLVTWDSADPCATLAIEETSRSTNNANAGQYPTWRITANNAGADKANVLYQTGFTQYYYILSPVFDVTGTEREVQKTVNGFGEETIRFSRTVVRPVMEFPDVPDYAISFLSRLGDISGVVFEDAVTGNGFEIEESDFETRRAGAFHNVGRLSFKAEQESFTGCQQNFELA